MNLSELKTDSKAEASGVWLPFMGARFLVASSDRSEYKRLSTRLMRQAGANELRRKPDLGEKLVGDCLAETCLLNWEGVTSDGTTPLPYSKSNAKVLCGHGEFRDWLANQASDPNNFRGEALATEAADLKSDP